MKIETLKKKLQKLGAPYTMDGEGEFNYEICFSIYGLNFRAVCDQAHDTVFSFYYWKGYDNVNQEQIRYFFLSFAHLLRYAAQNFVPAQDQVMRSYKIQWWNCKTGATTDKVFTGPDAYNDAVKWGKKNLSNFSLDVIRTIHI